METMPKILFSLWRLEITCTGPADSGYVKLYWETNKAVSVEIHLVVVHVVIVVVVVVTYVMMERQTCSSQETEMLVKKSN